LYPVQGRSGALGEGLRLIGRCDRFRAVAGEIARRFVVFGVFGAFAAGGAGCAGAFADQVTSVSAGHPARGVLLRGVEMPADGAGYAVPEGWRGRGTRYTTERVMRWLTSAFRRANDRDPETLVPLGDLSPRGGGEVGRHKSHENGRDVDIFLVAMDAEGRPFRPEGAMLRFGRDGRAIAWSPPLSTVRIREPVPPVRFDVRRNWAVVRALLEDPAVQVQRIFLNEALGRLMIEEAAAAGEPIELVGRAAALFRQPRRADPHDDHMHVRVACDPEDLAFGCTDRPPAPERRVRRRRRLALAEPADPSAVAPGPRATAASRG
jgi:penicillin-insensitive murein endopeptidase